MNPSEKKVNPGEGCERVKKKKLCVCVYTRTRTLEKGGERKGEKWKKGDQNP